MSTGTELGRILLADPLHFSMFLRKLWLRPRMLIKVSSFAVS